MPTPLLATKLIWPVPRRNLVSRRLLLKQLDENLFQGDGFNRKLTLVSAPAGYGKTTTISEWLMHIIPGEEKPAGELVVDSPGSKSELISSSLPRIAWLSLDEGDNDPVRFLAYFIAALREIDKDFGESSLSILQSPGQQNSEIILTTILNEIAEMSNAIVFVLDDYHVIHNLSIHQQLTFLLDHLPVQFHLVILSREDPLLPIARLRAREQVLEIRQHDLRFTIDEIDEFLVSVMGLSLSSAEIAALERRTEGWIAGLLLAALSMRSREDLSSFIQDFTGSSRFILDYLIEEVFNRQRPEIQNFLLKTSILDRLSGPLCNRVTETANSQGFLENLEQSNLFIVPLDQSRDWYRYHRLFAELLRHRLRMSGVDTAELHTRARKWFEENELQNEAIHHALAAQDWGRASQLIQEVTSDFLKHGEVLTIIKWYESLPGEMLVSDPKLCLDYCWSLLLGTQYEIAAPLLEEVEQAAQGIPVFLGEVYAAQAYLARGVGDHERMLERSQLALEKLPKSSVGSRGIVAVNLGIAYWHMGQMKPSEEAMLEAQEAGKATGNLYVVLTAWIFLGRVLAVRGKLHQAVEYFERAIHQGAGVPITALAYMDLAIINYEWNHLDISEANLHKAISLCEKSQNYEFLTGTLMIQSRLNGARGDFPAANQALEQAWDLVRDGKVPAPTVKRLKVAQARLFISSGNLPIEWRQSLTTSLDCHPNYRFLGVTKALSMPASQARIYLDELSEVALVNDWIYGLITVRALQAVFAQTQDQALDFLTEALRLAEDGGFIRSFVEAGEKLIPLLPKAAAQGISPEYVGQILSVMTRETGVSDLEVGDMVEPLTPRELEVLRLVSSGLSNREIASELVVSVGTAKTHVHNLCGKLGVRNRTEAAMKAKQLNMV